MDDRPLGPARHLARDHDLALEAAGGDPDLAEELFASLLAALPADLRAMRTSLGAGDWQRLAEQAHRLRGATRYCGVPGLDQAAEALERTALDAAAEEQIRERVVALEVEVGRLHAEREPMGP
jgi:two-component system sensor histidine kinase BarA